MSAAPAFSAIVTALPASRPFIAPEELARRAGGVELLRLGANESAFGPPPAALAAMTRELERASWYGDPESTELREALAARHGCGVENLCVGAGSDDLLGLIVRTFGDPGGASVATAGTYPTYAYHVNGYGLRHETVPYRDDGSVDLDALAAHAHATGARLAYLANPDNPSGSFAPPEAVARLRAALPAQTLLILDEAYADFVAPSERFPATFAANVVRVRTFSKAYGLAGARIGYAIAAPVTIAAFDKVRAQYGVNRIAQAGALAALDEDAFVAEVVAEVARGRDAYAALARAHGTRALPSSTNFVCIDLGTRARAEAMVEALLALGVFVRKPAAPPLDGHIRVTVGTAPERRRFAQAFARAYADLGTPVVSPS